MASSCSGTSPFLPMITSSPLPLQCGPNFPVHLPPYPSMHACMPIFTLQVAGLLTCVQADWVAADPLGRESISCRASLSAVGAAQRQTCQIHALTPTCSCRPHSSMGVELWKVLGRLSEGMDTTHSLQSRLQSAWVMGSAAATWIEGPSSDTPSMP